MYFKVSASLVDAQQFSGQRKYVFTIATENLALYDANLPSTSIFYNGTSKSLSVSLWFGDENHAQAFLTNLSPVLLQCRVHGTRPCNRGEGATTEGWKLDGST